MFFQVFTEIVICNCGFLDIAGVIAIRSEIKCLVWKMMVDAESMFLVKVWTMVIFTLVFCKFAFLKFFAIGADYIRMQIGKPKRSILKKVENKKQCYRIAAKVCLYMYLLSLLLCCFFRYGKKLLFLKKMLPIAAACIQVSLISLLLAIAPFVFAWLSPLF